MNELGRYEMFTVGHTGVTGAAKVLNGSVTDISDKTS